MIRISEPVLHDPNESLGREWLVSNGIGGYASSTILGANTRRYHGLLVASFPPPLERQVLLAKVDEEVICSSNIHQLSVNEYWDGTLSPRGDRLLHSFRLMYGLPHFEYSGAGWALSKRVFMEYGRNTVCLIYELSDESAPVVLVLRPFCAFRSYHALIRESDCTGFDSTSLYGSEVRISQDGKPYDLQLAVTPSGAFDSSPDWYRRFLYRVEKERGFDCIEDLYTPGVFTIPLQPRETVCLIATSEPEELESVEPEVVWQSELSRRRQVRAVERDTFSKDLVLAADQFLVRLKGTDGERASIMAGYHWFTDWGRDTMISLPGLLLCTGRFAEAREILLSHASHVRNGLIPNRFSDVGMPEYNTADASLWFIIALYRYAEASGDSEIIRLLQPTIREILDSHIAGTDYGIGIDPKDGLLKAGYEGTQLTWMDARVDDAPVTPRVGKPVEINALWYNSLLLAADWCGPEGIQYSSLAGKWLCSFRNRFWFDEGGYLFDVIDGPDGNDRSLRPNQILAVSLIHSPLVRQRQKAVVDTVERHLLTPYGLRTLSQDDSKYQGQYGGGPHVRDSAYHQGTVWPWLLGQFLDAHLRVYGDKPKIRRMLLPLKAHLRDAGLGTISEVFSGDAPHSPGGCISQAWSVAEILRAWMNAQD